VSTKTTEDLGDGYRPKLIGQEMVDKALAAGQYVRRMVNEDGTVTVLHEVSRRRVPRSEAAVLLGLEEKGN
jgi:hypothetical protein